MIDYLTVALVVIGGLAAMTVFMAGFVMIRRKINKERGLWKAHRKYRPARPKRILHF